MSDREQFEAFLSRASMMMEGSYETQLGVWHWIQVGRTSLRWFTAHPEFRVCERGTFAMVKDQVEKLTGGRHA